MLQQGFDTVMSGYVYAFRGKYKLESDFYHSQHYSRHHTYIVRQLQVHFE